MQQANPETERRWSNRTVLREIDDRHVRRLGRVVLSIVVALAPTAVYLLQHNESVKIAYEVNDLRADVVAGGGAHREFGAEPLPPLRQAGFQRLAGNRAMQETGDHR